MRIRSTKGPCRRNKQSIYGTEQGVNLANLILYQYRKRLRIVGKGAKDEALPSTFNQTKQREKPVLDNGKSECGIFNNLTGRNLVICLAQDVEPTNNSRMSSSVVGVQSLDDSVAFALSHSSKGQHITIEQIPWAIHILQPLIESNSKHRESCRIRKWN